MKKTIIVLSMVMIAAMLFVSCDNKANEPEEKTYEIGETGPAGGYIFYDCDADNTEDGGAGEDGLMSSECGWRYLEAAAGDAVSASGYYGYAWGPDGKNYGTKPGIGEGKNNTAIILSQPKPTYTGNEEYKPEYYEAAKACGDYGDNTDHDDWFLPSKEELHLMYNVLKVEKKIGDFTNNQYWSSSENGTSAERCAVYFLNGSDNNISGGAGSFLHVRPIRQFK